MPLPKNNKYKGMTNQKRISNGQPESIITSKYNNKYKQKLPKLK